jgi:hypothetical protein
VKELNEAIGELYSQRCGGKNCNILVIRSVNAWTWEELPLAAFDRPSIARNYTENLAGQRLG